MDGEQKRRVEMLSKKLKQVANRIQNHKTSSDEDDALGQYLETALWSSTDTMPGHEGEEPEHLDGNFGIEDISPETKAKCKKDVDEFFQKAKELLGDAFLELDPTSVGHDFWLTRNGHGAGFWDGDYPKDIGDKLTELSHSFGGVDMYIGDDLQIWI